MNFVNQIDLAGKLERQGKFEEAAEIYLEILSAEPDNAEILFKYAILCTEKLDQKKAVEIFSTLVDRHPEMEGVHDLLAVSLINAGNYIDAVKYFDLQFSKTPQKFKQIAKISKLIVELGKADVARNLLKKALEYYQDDTKIAIALNAISDSENEIEESIARSEKIASGGNISQEDTAIFMFSLAALYSKKGEYEKSFAMLDDANKIVRSSISDYDVKIDELIFSSCQKVFTKEWIDKVSGMGMRGPSPIFIVGMPRSGSTLLEQILGAHSQILPLGEVSYLYEVVAEKVRLMSNEIGFPIVWRDANADDFEYLAKEYLHKIPRTLNGATTTVDKRLPNMIFVGLIHAAFPNAKIIHCLRNPIDTCLSCYQQSFSPNVAFTFDLTELGHYFKASSQLAMHWKSVLPSSAYAEVHYEDVVEDMESEIRRILSFCGLEWEDNCRNYHNLNRAVKTASINQVRKPIYKTSIKKWKRYENQLAPLISALGEFADKE